MVSVFLLTAIWQLHPKLASVSISLKNYVHIIYCNHMCCNLSHRWYCTKKSNLNPGRQCHIYFINRFLHEKNTSFSVCMVFDWNTYSKTQRCNQHEKVIIEKYSISSLFNIQSKYGCSIHIDLLMNYRELSLLVEIAAVESKKYCTAVEELSYWLVEKLSNPMIH